MRIMWEQKGSQLIGDEAFDIKRHSDGLGPHELLRSAVAQLFARDLDVTKVRNSPSWQVLVLKDVVSSFTDIPLSQNQSCKVETLHFPPAHHLQIVGCILASFVGLGERDCRHEHPRAEDAICHHQDRSFALRQLVLQQVLVLEDSQSRRWGREVCSPLSSLPRGEVACHLRHNILECALLLRAEPFLGQVTCVNLQVQLQGAAAEFCKRGHWL
mmetsp:Transcript_60093/g.143198  ORF Transcript_60093/g.143198 Transcript_60093/m.143198 type:complete len:214 (-) Transcript_60093:545-1186(-)